MFQSLSSIYNCIDLYMFMNEFDSKCPQRLVWKSVDELPTSATANIKANTTNLSVCKSRKEKFHQWYHLLPFLIFPMGHGCCFVWSTLCSRGFLYLWQLDSTYLSVCRNHEGKFHPWSHLLPFLIFPVSHGCCFVWSTLYSKGFLYLWQLGFNKHWSGRLYEMKHMALSILNHYCGYPIRTHLI